MAVVALTLLLPSLGLLSLSAAAKEPSRPDPVRIGLIATLFRDLPQPLVSVATRPFRSLMESQTGLHGEVTVEEDPVKLGEQLANDQLHLAVFHGYEFARARHKHPELRPLAIVLNQERHLRAHLLVRKESKAASLADLEGKSLALPRFTLEHCRIYLERHCEKQGSLPKQFFARITTPPNIEEALDDVVDGAVQATLVDGVALERYKRRKPGRFHSLKEIQESEIFPTALIAYHPGAVDEATVRVFRDGMINSNKTALGRQLLTLWKVTAFEPIPDDYEQTLADIVKAYPLPESEPKKAQESRTPPLSPPVEAAHRAAGGQ